MTRRSAFDQSQAKTAEPRDRSPRTIEFLRADLPFPFLLIPLRGSAVGNDPRRGRTPHPTGEQGSRRPSSREDLRGFYCIDLSLYPRPLSSQITADESGPQRCFSTAFHPLHHCLKRGGMPAYSSRIFLSGVHSRFSLLPVFTVSHSTVVVLVETRCYVTPASPRIHKARASRSEKIPGLARSYRRFDNSFCFQARSSVFSCSPNE